MRAVFPPSSPPRAYALANPRRNATNNLFNERFLRSRRPHYIFLGALNRVVGRCGQCAIGGCLWSPLWSPAGARAVLRATAPALLVTGTPGTEHLDGSFCGAPVGSGSRACAWY